MKKKNGAFTLIEIMVAVMIIAVIAGLAVPNFLRMQAKSKIDKVKGELATLKYAVENYYAQHEDHIYPASLSDLTKTEKGVTALINYVPQDPFSASNNNYQYQRGENHYYVIYSIGPDRNGSAQVVIQALGYTVQEQNGASCIFVSNAAEDETGP